MTIIIDHQLNSLNISSDRDLLEIASPFYVYNDSILISPRFVIQRIDLQLPLRDSISENEGGIIASAQSWLVGGKKNHVKYKKIREKNINKKNLDIGFAQLLGNGKFIDTFFKQNNAEYIFFVKDNIAYNNYKRFNFKVFNRVDSLQNFIKNSLSLAQSGKKKISIIFKPNQQYEKENNYQIKLTSSQKNADKISVHKKDTIIHLPTAKSVKEKFSNSKAPESSTVFQAVSKKVIYDPRIKYCKTIFNDEDKLVYFFTDIFRYVRGSLYDSPEYKALLKDIADVLISTLPIIKGIDGKFKKSYLISCSNKTDFIKECSELNN
jgi:hypothetical protein